MSKQVSQAVRLASHGGIAGILAAATMPHFFIREYSGIGVRDNTNDLSNVTPQILAQGLLALRENCVMPALVNSSYSEDAKEKGETVNIDIPSAIAAQDVTPARTAPDDAGVTPTKAQITLDQWKEAPFFMSDKDLANAKAGVVPGQMTEAVKAIANAVNQYLFSLYTGIYGFNGTPGTTPFAPVGATNPNGIPDATAARRNLNAQLAPKGPRYFVMDPDAEANALNLRPFQDTNFAVNAMDVREGNLTEKLGFGWLMDQDVPTHTAGALGGTPVAGAAAAGAKSVPVTAGGAAGTGKKGDILTFAGHTQTYTLTADATLDGAGAGTLAVEPGLQVALSGGEAITQKADHVVNLAFHRDAFGFASRPLLDVEMGGLGSIIESATDPVSGLTLRLEVTRQHKRVRWAYDILFGGALVRAELANRTAG